MHRRTAKQQWQEIGGKKIFFRSNWEFKYAQALEQLVHARLIRGWEHEPQTFWFESIKRGVRSYKPDFKIYHIDGTHSWVEVKGYYDAKSLTKIKRFRKYYPQETLQVIDGSYFRSHKTKAQAKKEEAPGVEEHGASL